MSESIARKFDREFRQIASNAESIAYERERIKRVRREAAIRSGSDSELVELQETPEQKLRRWQAIADEQRQEIEATVERRLRRDFLRAAERGNARLVAASLDEGLPANAQDPETGETALHIASGVGARNVVRALLSTGECDHLIKDNFGRLASECAYLFGDDPPLSRLLAIKEKEQAQDIGQTLSWRRDPD